MGNCSSSEPRRRPAATQHPQRYKKGATQAHVDRIAGNEPGPPPPTPPPRHSPPPRSSPPLQHRLPQPIPQHQRQPPAKRPALPPGTRVDGYWENSWYPGAIKHANPDGTYDLHWDDGSLSVGVPPEFVRPQRVGGGGSPPPPPGRQPANQVPAIRLGRGIVASIGQADEVGIDLFRSIGGTPGQLLPAAHGERRLEDRATLKLFGWPAGRHRELMALLMQEDEQGHRVLTHECCQHYARVQYLFALVDNDQDGRISEWELRKALMNTKDLGTTVRQQFGIGEHLAGALFRQMDRDGNGHISLVEFFRHYVENPLGKIYSERALDARELFARVRGAHGVVHLKDLERAMASQAVQLELGWPQHKARQLFEFLDVNGDGSVTLQEMQRFLTLQQVFNRIDVDRTGFIDPFEFGEAMGDPELARVLNVPCQDCQRVFREIDHDRSDTITFAEFYAYFYRHAHLDAPIPAPSPMKRQQQGMQKYVKHGLLGEGTFGRVFLITRKTDGLKLIMKEPKVEEVSDMADVQAEADMLAKVKHPNIVRFTESFWVGGALIIITEFAGGGDLRSKVGQRHSPERVMRWFCEAADGVNYLHERCIIHRDLKPDNIFLTEGGHVKIGDLGLATQMRSKHDRAQTGCGTPVYMPPELYDGTGYTVQNDVWAMGCILYELATGRLAFEHQAQIVRGEIPQDAPSYCRDLVAGMLVMDMGRRMTIAQVLAALQFRPASGNEFSLTNRNRHRR